MASCFIGMIEEIRSILLPLLPLPPPSPPQPKLVALDVAANLDTKISVRFEKDHRDVQWNVDGKPHPDGTTDIPTNKTKVYRARDATNPQIIASGRITVSSSSTQKDLFKMAFQASTIGKDEVIYTCELVESCQVSIRLTWKVGDADYSLTLLQGPKMSFSMPRTWPLNINVMRNVVHHFQLFKNTEPEVEIYAHLRNTRDLRWSWNGKPVSSDQDLSESVDELEAVQLAPTRYTGVLFSVGYRKTVDGKKVVCEMIRINCGYSDGEITYDFKVRSFDRGVVRNVIISKGQGFCTPSNLYNSSGGNGTLKGKDLRPYIYFF